MEMICTKIIQTLVRKDDSYDSSWKKRGGVGAFMMLARKMDRIEAACGRNHWDIFAAIMKDPDKLIDDIDDLIGYLLLVREYMINDVAGDTVRTGE